jgi:hypothetical protein
VKKRKTTLLGLRLEPAELRRLDAMVAKVQGGLTRSGVARAALSIGLDELDRHPEKLVKA